MTEGLRRKNLQFGDIKGSIPLCKLKRVIRERRCLQHPSFACGAQFRALWPFVLPKYWFIVCAMAPTHISCGHLQRSGMVVCGHQNKTQAGGGSWGGTPEGSCFGPSFWGHRLLPESDWLASASTCSAARTSAELQPASGRTTHLRQDHAPQAGG